MGIYINTFALTIIIITTATILGLVPVLNTLGHTCQYYIMLRINTCVLLIILKNTLLSPDVNPMTWGFLFVMVALTYNRSILTSCLVDPSD